MTTHIRRRFGGRDWHHPAVHALMEGVSPHQDPFEVVRTKAREMVARARGFGWSGPPFDPLQLASIEGIRARASETAMAGDALIGPLGDGSLEIVWNDDAAPTRKNFSICHELGHTLFPDAYEVVHYRSAHNSAIDDELERLCDAAAAEILMPAEEFVRDLAARPLDAQVIPVLATMYAASPEATARRIATLSARACAVVVLTCRLKPVEVRQASQMTFDGASRFSPKLRVDYVIPSPSFALHLPEHKSVPDESCAYGVAGGPCSALETWDTGKARVKLSVHALNIPPDEDGQTRAIALIVPRSAPSRELSS